MTTMQEYLKSIREVKDLDFNILIDEFIKKYQHLYPRDSQFTTDEILTILTYELINTDINDNDIASLAKIDASFRVEDKIGKNSSNFSNFIAASCYALSLKKVEKDTVDSISKQKIEKAADLFIEPKPENLDSFSSKCSEYQENFLKQSKVFFNEYKAAYSHISNLKFTLFNNLISFFKSEPKAEQISGKPTQVKCQV